jgi:hypothetical protein
VYGQHGDGDGHESSTVGEGYGQQGDGDGSRVWSTWRWRWIKGMVNIEKGMHQGCGQQGDGDGSRVWSTHGHESSTVGEGYGQQGDGDASRVWSTGRWTWT